MSNLLNLPLFSMVISFIFGWIGTWRRAITFFLFSYAALIIAFQHNSAISNLGILRSIAGSSNSVRSSALGFAISLVIIFIGLNVLFRYVWGEESQSLDGQTSLDKVAQSSITAIAGWGLGVMLALSLGVFLEVSILLPGMRSENPLLANAIAKTADIVTGLVEPWLPYTIANRAFDIIESDVLPSSLSPSEQPVISPTIEPTAMPLETVIHPQVPGVEIIPETPIGQKITLIFPEENAYIRGREAEQYFSWNLEGSLAENQSFSIHFYKIGEMDPETPFGWVRDNGQLINLNNLTGGGDYEWSVVIVQEIDGNWEKDVYESPRRPIKWEG